MTDWQEGYTNANGLDIHYHRTGGTGKPALVLLHGLTDNGLCWTRVALDLQDDYDVIMPDARGHGQTGGQVDGFSVGMLAGDLAALIGAMRLERPYLFGHSMGAITAMMLAANYPGLARAIVLEDPPLFSEERADEEVEARVEGAHDLKAMSPEELAGWVRTENPGWVDKEVEPWVEAQMQFNPEVVRLRFGEPWRAIVERMNCPALLVTADPDGGALVTPEQAQEAIELSTRKGAPLVEVAHIANAGHCIHRDRYDETMAEVRRFLASH